MSSEYAGYVSGRGRTEENSRVLLKQAGKQNFLHMLTDSVADFLIRIKNGYMAKKSSVVVRYTNVNKALAEKLASGGYVGKVTEQEERKSIKNLVIELKYQGKMPKITHIQKMSKPGRKIYLKSDDLSRMTKGLGDILISTPKGIMFGKEAKKQHTGGEFICKFF